MTQRITREIDALERAARRLSRPSDTGRRGPSRSRVGVVLIVVTVAILMLSLAGLSFVSMMSTENKAVHVHTDELQAEHLIGSGAELLGALLARSPEQRQLAGGCFDNPELFRGALVVADDLGGRHGRFSVVSPQIENDEITAMRFGAADESARLNLAVLPLWEQQQAGAAREALLNLPGMTEAIADAILDWIDADPASRQFGAEADYYTGLRVPYAPRNAAPASIEELMLVRGVTRALLMGADANLNYQLEPAETDAARQAQGVSLSGARLTWASYLTVYSAERNVNPQGEPRVDLNEQDLDALHEKLTALFNPAWADFVVFYRQYGPYEEAEASGPSDADAMAPTNESVPPETPRRVTGVGRGRSAPSLDLSVPAAFEITSVLDLVGAEVRVANPAAASDPSAEPYSLVENPLDDDPASVRVYLPELLDHATVDPRKVIRGRVNVNSAPRAVLAGVPGLDGALVEQIAAARRRPGARDDAGRRHVTWLLTEGLVDLPKMKALLPYLTTGGDVFRAQIVGFFDEPAPTARAELVIDATESPPRQLYYKDLRLLGVGYPLEALGAVAPAARR
ncbi:MAG: general secretion pathway protein GspK [Pirellulales bacterium]|nr:general secretion pathway protein GspK [Pirellulales bacterium]